MSEYIHPLIAAILKELPKAGDPLPAKRKELFVKTFESILDVLYQSTSPKDLRTVPSIE